MNYMIKIIGLTVLAFICLTMMTCGMIYFAAKMGTKKGHFIVIPENGPSFNVKQVTFISNNTISYYKDDGTSGRICGNFRIERIEDVPIKLENN